MEGERNIIEIRGSPVPQIMAKARQDWGSRLVAMRLIDNFLSVRPLPCGPPLCSHWATRPPPGTLHLSLSASSSPPQQTPIPLSLPLPLFLRDRRHCLASLPPSALPPPLTWRCLRTSSCLHQSHQKIHGFGAVLPLLSLPLWRFSWPSQTFPLRRQRWRRGRLNVQEPPL